MRLRLSRYKKAGQLGHCQEALLPHTDWTLCPLRLGRLKISNMYIERRKKRLLLWQKTTKWTRFKVTSIPIWRKKVMQKSTFFSIRLYAKLGITLLKSIETKSIGLCLTVACWLISSPLAVLQARSFTGTHQKQFASAAVPHFVVNPKWVACSCGASWDTRVSTVVPR